MTMMSEHDRPSEAAERARRARQRHQFQTMLKQIFTVFIGQREAVRKVPPGVILLLYAVLIMFGVLSYWMGNAFERPDLIITGHLTNLKLFELVAAAFLAPLLCGPALILLGTKPELIWVIGWVFGSGLVFDLMVALNGP